MNRQNKKERVAALHRANILLAAEKLFSDKGFAATTIDDISRLSEYSRRTIYAYFDSKENILYHIVLKGLLALEKGLAQAVGSNGGFLQQYRAICRAMQRYHMDSPHSFSAVESMETSTLDIDSMPKVVTDIITAGIAVNGILAEWIEEGRRDGVVRQDVKTMPTVYVLWSSISSLLNLARSKGSFIEAELGMTLDEFLEYGFGQVANSILEVRV